MEGGSEEEKKKRAEGENKAKRKMKTASQLEILENTFAVETYPSESLRAELSVKLGLSDRQLQMWFCHRRLKDRKATPVKKPVKDSEDVVIGDIGNEHVVRSGSGLSPYGHGGVDLGRVGPRSGVAIARIGSDMPPTKRYYGAQQSTVEVRAIAFIEAQLGEPLREDGPILGLEFDSLPPDAFGAPIGGREKKSGLPFEATIYERPEAKHIKVSGRSLHEYQFLPEQPTDRTDNYERTAPSYHCGSPVNGPNSRASVSSFPAQVSNLNLSTQQGRQGYPFPYATDDYENISRKSLFLNTAVDAQYSTHPITQLENPFMTSDWRVSHDEDALRMERKQKNEEARIAREVEAHEKRIRKELEKQDILRRKREEQVRKEMERQDRERRKEEERLLREKQKEEERYIREQRREMERREKFLLKESIRAEKMRQKEEMRREKESARIKAANERAHARRIAKESSELVDDERLELMELAASTKELTSILSLDYETLQNLELYRDMQTVFPPKAVEMKRPFDLQPWTDSEENIGNLLMVWRFLITFADVLGLWPFTLDEFIQACHDYDPRLLGEIHISLLRLIIKDIEDVARTPANGLGANQNNAANVGGGHPQIVQGAYAWGFNIHSWQCYLNLLTWPEILRQFALSAGFGPQLKRKSTRLVYLHDENEGTNGEDIICNLRNGAAAENAVAIMNERGLSNPNRSRHRLTIGTVKFAAFHVLSLEGNKGLTILEVVEKIQKSGLRDLTTSKTPEASVAAALSRDTKLFERTAPSTYCVRSSYRKDAADSEAILSAARERIRIFKSGFLDEVYAEDGERDEDSESDGAEDPEVDDLGTEIKKETKSQGHNSDANNTVGLGKEINDAMETSQADMGNGGQDLSTMDSEGSLKTKETGATINQACDFIGNLDLEDKDIDESKPGEPWVQGLVEGEYSDITVEERLNALCALIGVVMEGNSIRIILEERLEAAKALKKRMWSEAQLDKRRSKEDYCSFPANKNEANFTHLSGEGRQSPSHDIYSKNNETSLEPDQKDWLGNLKSENNNHINLPSEGNLRMQDYPTTANDNLQLQESGLASEKSHSQLKSYIGHKAEEMYVYRSLPLGQDRRHNRYWQFVTSSRHDPGCGRIFVELHNGFWRIIDTEEGFNALLASLDVRGVRESHLNTILQKIESTFKESVRRKSLHVKIGSQIENSSKSNTDKMAQKCDSGAGTDSPCSAVCVSDSDMSETSTSFTIELGRNEKEKKDALKRYQDFEKWMWKECFNSHILSAMRYGKKRAIQLLNICNYCRCIYSFEDNHCPSCHSNYNSLESEVNFSEHVALCHEKLSGSFTSPLRIRLLKILLALVEVSVPMEALQSFWTEGIRKSWGMKLCSSSSTEELLQILTSLESAIRRENLSPKYETTMELLGRSSASPCMANDTFLPEKAPILPWIPLTTAAIALRLMELDTSIFYTQQQKLESKDHGSANLATFPSKFSIAKYSQDYKATATPNKHHTEANWANPPYGPSSSGRGRGGAQGKAGTRPHGGRSKKTNFGPVLAWKAGKSRGKPKRGRGRRSIRKRPRLAKKEEDQSAQKNDVYSKSPLSLVQDWNEDHTMMFSNQGMENDMVDAYADGFDGKSDENFLDGKSNVTDHSINDDDDDDDDNDDGDDDDDEAEEEERRGSGDEYEMEDGYADPFDGKSDDTILEESYCNNVNNGDEDDFDYVNNEEEEDDDSGEQ